MSITDKVDRKHRNYSKDMQHSEIHLLKFKIGPIVCGLSNTVESQRIGIIFKSFVIKNFNEDLVYSQAALTEQADELDEESKIDNSMSEQSSKYF